MSPAHWFQSLRAMVPREVGEAPAQEYRGRIIGARRSPLLSEHYPPEGDLHPLPQRAAKWVSAYVVVGLIALVSSLVIGGEGETSLHILALSAIVWMTSCGIVWAQTRLNVRNERFAQTMEERARRAEAVLSSFERGGNNWLWEVDRDFNLTYVSPKFAQLVDEDIASLRGASLIDVLRAHADRRDYHSGFRALEFRLQAKLPFHDVTLPLFVRGSKIWLSVSGGALFDERKHFTGFSGVGADLTSVRENEDSVRQLALYDSLTGVANRGHFNELLGGLIARASSHRSPCTLLYIDLDRFKIVNDTLGHPVGDEILKEVARRIEYVVKSHGQAGRLGGDEFAVVLPNGPSKELVEDLARRLISDLSAPYHVGPSQIIIGASIGVASGPVDGATSQELIGSADLALYAAKKAGRGVFRSYDPAMRTSAERRQSLEMDLREALQKGQLSLAYQPIFDLRTDDLVGFEALMRWQHPQHGSIYPELFIGIAEDSGMIPVLGEWALRTALMQAARWPDNISIAVNLSPLQFQDASLTAKIVSALSASQLEPARLELEITESLFLQETDTTHSVLEKLRELGIRLALDDFGTGYSSLGYLRKGSFSKLKIDKSFVKGINFEGSDNRAIVRAITALAESLGMSTTAEGAETPEEIRALKAIGCEQVQGFAYGHPMSADDATALISMPLISHSGDAFPEREGRLHFLRAIDVASGRRRCTAVVKNLSPGGALIETSGALRLGDPVELLEPELGNPRGTVRWVRGNRRGVMFDERIELKLLAKIASHQSIDNPAPTEVSHSRSAVG